MTELPPVVEKPRLAEPEPDPPPKPQVRHREPREPKEPKEKPAGETVQGRIVSAYREGAGLTLHLDKGSAAGVGAIHVRALADAAETRLRAGAGAVPVDDLAAAVARALAEIAEARA